MPLAVSDLIYNLRIRSNISILFMLIISQNMVLVKAKGESFAYKTINAYTAIIRLDNAKPT